MQPAGSAFGFAAVAAAVVLGAAAAAAAPRQQAPGRTATAPQQPDRDAPRPANDAAGGLGVAFDRNGWPIVQEPPPRDVFAPRTPPAAPPQGSGAARDGAPATGNTPWNARASTGPAPVGVAPTSLLASPLLQVFQATRAPGTFRALGKVAVTWRLTVHGVQGEPLAVRELAHFADVAAPAADRLELGDGRVYRREGTVVFAERQGMPWPTLADAAADELSFYGLHLRMPWCFADAAAFTVEGAEAVQRGGERLLRIRIVGRSERDAVGPMPAGEARDVFELWCEPSSGEPRELVHTFARSAGSRRVLLEDWREHDGVRMPHRRVYVDGGGRPTTILTLADLARR